jgi:hypothetical protein
MSSTDSKLNASFRDSFTPKPLKRLVVLSVTEWFTQTRVPFGTSFQLPVWAYIYMNVIHAAKITPCFRKVMLIILLEHKSAAF